MSTIDQDSEPVACAPPGPVQAAIADCYEAHSAKATATARLRCLEMNLEEAVLQALGDDGVLPPSAGHPVTVICNDTVVTLLPSDVRPSVRVEPANFVE